MQHTSIIAVLKKKKPEHNYGIIYIRGFYNRKPVKAISTGHRVLIINWDPENRRVFPKAPNANLINGCIDSKLQQMQAQVMRAEIMSGKVNRRNIKDAISGKDSSKDFFDFCKQIIKLNYTNTETIRTYNSELTKLEAFKSEVSFSDIDHDFLQHYRYYMRETLANSQNTIWKTFKFFRTMITYAKKQGGIITEDPFEEFNRGSYEQTERSYLTIDECERIYKLAENEQVPVIMRRVAIYFLLMCYSGLRYEDAITFNPAEHIIENERLVRKTSKGKGVMINIKLYGRLREVVELTKKYPLQLTNQKMNEWLKLIAVHACITKKLTCHVGRHTFGSLLPDAGISKEAAQKLLGHADMRSTNVYYHMKEKNVDDAADKLNSL